MSSSRPVPAKGFRLSHSGVTGGVWCSMLLVLLSVLPVCAAPPNYKMTDPEEDARKEEAQKAQRVQELISVPCKSRLKNQKILFLVAEKVQSGWEGAQERYDPFKATIDARLHNLGLRTFTQEQIRQQIAQAEVEAYFRNDPDAALAASKRLSAAYILRGEILTTQALNPLVKIPEVTVTLNFTLSSATGRVLSHARSRSESYSNNDTLHMAETLVEEQADELVGQLYHDYCSSAGH